MGNSPQSVRTALLSKEEEEEEEEEEDEQKEANEGVAVIPAFASGRLHGDLEVVRAAVETGGGDPARVQEVASRLASEGPEGARPDGRSAVVAFWLFRWGAV